MSAPCGRKTPSLAVPAAPTSPLVATSSVVNGGCTGRLISVESPGTVLPPQVRAPTLKRSVTVGSVPATICQATTCSAPRWARCVAPGPPAARVAPLTASVTSASAAQPARFSTITAGLLWSPLTRKRDVRGRSSSGLLATISLVACPTRVSGVTASAVMRQVVRLSGSFTATTACPSAPVVTWPRQKAVSANCRRTSVLEPGPPPPPPFAPVPCSEATWSASSSRLLAVVNSSERTP